MNTILALHNVLRWAVLLFGLVTLLRAIGAMSSGRMYNSGDNKSSLFFMISCDIQLLLGLALFFMNNWFTMVKDGMGDVMKNTLARFFIVEHAGMMIVAWILVHVGRTSVKRTVFDKSKHKKSLIFFGLAMLLILASIPWPFRGLTGRPYFPVF
jgi:hypothetical protein